MDFLLNVHYFTWTKVTSGLLKTINNRQYIDNGVISNFLFREQGFLVEVQGNSSYRFYIFLKYVELSFFVCRFGLLS